VVDATAEPSPATSPTPAPNPTVRRTPANYRIGSPGSSARGAEDLFLPWNGTTILAGGSRRFRIPIGIENSGSAGSAASLLSPRRVTLLPRVLPGMRADSR
jgi:hypothetical protein